MKIFHCADLHLESPFSALSPQTALKKKRELVSVFVAMTEYARAESVDLFLVAGDLFDTFKISDETKKAVKEALASLNCPVVISPGNHDKYIKGGFYTELNNLENVKVFTSEEMGREDFDELGISVHGYAFTSGIYEKNPLADGVELSNENINILCAHSDILNPIGNQMAPLNTSEIAECGFVYAALGHIHKPPEPKIIGNCTVAYSGFAQGRDFGETGTGNANIVNIDRETKKVSVEKKQFSKSRYQIEWLDISGCERDIDIIKKIEKILKQKGYESGVSLRVILSGAISRDFTPSIRRIEGYNGFSSLDLLEVKDQSLSVLGLEYLEKDMTLRGEFYRLLLPKLSSADENERKEALLALKFGLSALSSQEIAIIGNEGEDNENN